MKYEVPELKVIEFDVADVIQTSDGGAGGNNELPPWFPPAPTSLDEDF